MLGEGNGTPLQYSCLENPMDGGAWKAAVHGVTKSRTRLSDFPFIFHFPALEKEMATHSSVLPGESQGRQSLVGCRLWGRTESDTTEQLSSSSSSMHAKSLQSCSTLCHSMDCRLPGSFAYGILQARILELIAMPSSRGSSMTQESNLCLLGLLHWQAGYLPLGHLGSPICVYNKNSNSNFL